MRRAPSVWWGEVSIMPPFLLRPLTFRWPRFLWLGAVVCLWGAWPAVAAVVYWDANADGAGTGGSGLWSTTGAALFRTDATAGALVNWSSSATNSDTAVFGGTAGTVTLDNRTIVAEALSFLNSYTLAGAGSSSKLQFSGTAPVLAVAGGKRLTLATLLDGSATTSLSLRGGGELVYDQNGAGRMGSSLGLTIDDGSMIAFGNSTVTLRAVTLINGSLGSSRSDLSENSNLTAGSFDVQQGVITTSLHGTGGLTKTSDYTVTIRGRSDYSGTTSVTAGILELAGTNSLSTNAALVVDGGTLSLPGLAQAAPTVTLVSGSILGPGTLRSSSQNTPVIVQSGTITAYLQANGGMTKTGPGTVALGSTADMNNHTTYVNGGVLDLTRATLLNTNIVVNSGGTLVGSGAGLGNIKVDLSGGRLSPGGDLATSSLATGDEKWSSNSGFDFNVWNATGVAGTGYDTLAINGKLQLAGLGAQKFELKVIGLVGATGGAGLVANFNGTMGHPAGYSWTFATASGGITGFTANKFLVDSSGFTNPYTGSFSVEQSGNSLNLVFTPVPEPATFALLLGIGTLGFIALRRRRGAPVTV